MKLFTPNMNDEELDELFRKAAEHSSRRYDDKPDPAGKAALWKALDKKLGTPPSSTQSGRRKRGYLFMLIFTCIIIGFFAWLFYRGENRMDQASPNITQNLSNAKHSSTQNEKKKEDSLTINSSKNSQSSLQMEKQKSRDINGYIALHKPIVKEPGPLTASTEDIVATANKDMEKNIASSIISSPGPAQQKLSGTAANFPRINSVTIPDNWSLPKIHFIVGKKDAVSFNVNSDSTQQAHLSPIDIKTSRPPSQQFRWQLGLTTGPDWNSASGKGWRTGIGGGLTLTYHFNQKWAISSGVLIDKKLYDAKPNDYNPPDNNWRNYDVKSIDANCSVIDLPLNIEYTLKSFGSNRLFIRSGLSSLWMHKEDYTYNYKTSSGNWNQWTKEIRDKNYHLFSIINFSPGYEHSWQHLSIQISPYIKIPVGGVGYGKIRLYSSGIHLTLQYGLK